MFTRGLAGRGGVGRLGEFVNQNWKAENWLKYSSPSASLIPGISNQTAAVGGGIAAALAAAAAAWFFLKK